MVRLGNCGDRSKSGMKSTEIKYSRISPRALSVSRATDIPAFHVPWLLERLETGYCEWTNPFNFRQIQRVSFEDCKAFVFWSKNPAPLVPHLAKFDEKNIGYYFQFTLNDYENEQLEPGVPPLEERMETFRKLAGICPVVWRYDPVIMGSGLTVKEHLRRINAMADKIAPFAESLVFSFVDIKAYSRVEKRIRNFNSDLREPTPEEMREFASGVANLNSKLAKPLKIGACGEAGDFSAFGIEKSRCVDPDLLEKIVPQPVRALVPMRQFDHAKDRGQRAVCGCAKSKDIGGYRMKCGHKCVYCYANQ